MSAKIQLRRDTTWAGTETLAAGEVGIQFDAAGTVGGIKIGPVGGNTWSNIDYMSGTFPFTATSAASVNDASLSKSGRFKWAAAATITTNAPIAFVADDGAAMMTTSVYGTSVVQALSTEGNGTVPTKHFIRVYDGDVAAWRTWENVNTWATSSTDGTDLTAKNITAKAIVKIANGTVGSPSIAFETDTNTGLYISGTDQLGISVNGTKSAHFTSGQFLPNSIACTTSGSFGTTLGVSGVSTLNQINMASLAKITGLGNPVAGTDAMNWQTMADNIAILFGSTDGARTASNGSNWTVANLTSPTLPTTFTPSVSGNYDALVMFWAGGAALDLQSAKSRTVNNTTVPSSSVLAASQLFLMIAIKRP